MSRNSTSQARVINPVLTRAARGFEPTGLAWRSLLPPVPVTERGGTRIEFDASSFVARETLRAPGSKAARGEFGYAGQPYALQPHSFDGQLPIENDEEAMRVPGINMQTITVQNTRQILELGYEREAAALCTNASNYGGNTLALTSGNRWDEANGTPGPDVAAANEAIRQATGGKEGNTLVLGGKVFNQCRWGDHIAERTKYVQRGAPSLDDLRSYFNVQNIVVARSAEAADEAATGGFTDLWDNVAILAYVAQGTIARPLPSFGYTYEIPMIARSPYYEDDVRSWLFPMDWHRSAEIVGPGAGFLLTNVVT
mgnify:CR=1 FL=1